VTWPTCSVNWPRRRPLEQRLKPRLREREPTLRTHEVAIVTVLATVAVVVTLLGEEGAKTALLVLLLVSHFHRPCQPQPRGHFEQQLPISLRGLVRALIG